MAAGNWTVGVLYYSGGAGFLSIFKEHCRIYDLPDNKCELIRQSIQIVWDESVDIVIGNHPNHNCTHESFYQSDCMEDLSDGS